MNPIYEKFFGHTPNQKGNLAATIMHNTLMSFFSTQSSSWTVSFAKGFPTLPYNTILYKGFLMKSVTDSVIASDVPNILKTDHSNLSGWSWKNYVKALVCQVGYNANYVKQPGNVEIDTGGWGAYIYVSHLNVILYRLYGHAIASPLYTPLKEVNTSIRQAGSTDSLKSFYLKNFISDHFITATKAKWVSPGTHHPTWEIFNHIAKMGFLNCTKDEINQALSTAIKKGLPIPGAVRPNQFDYYFKWMPFGDQLMDMTMFSNETRALFGDKVKIPTGYPLMPALPIPGYYYTYFLRNWAKEWWNGKDPSISANAA